jgi:hypothetical protein
MASVIVANNVGELGAQWAAAQMGNAVYVWRFSQSLLSFAGANPSLKLADIGEELAKAAQRPTPYSKTWVSRALKAARTVQDEPQTESAATAFCDLFYGNVARTATTKAKTSPSAEDALKAAINFAKRAVKLGMKADEVAGAVSDAVGEGEDTLADATAAPVVAVAA